MELWELGKYVMLLSSSRQQQNFRGKVGLRLRRWRNQGEGVWEGGREIGERFRVKSQRIHTTFGGRIQSKHHRTLKIQPIEGEDKLAACLHKTEIRKLKGLNEKHL